MDETSYLYKIGSGKLPVILSFIMSAVFGGVAFWLYRTENGAFIFLAFLFALTFLVFLLSVYRFFFYKVLIGVNGFYYRTRLGNGKHYLYSEVEKAWVSSGKSRDGLEDSYCNISFYNGAVIRFMFYATDEEAVNYLIEHSAAAKAPEAANERETYRIDGKYLGKAQIAGGIFILIILLVMDYIMAKAFELWFLLIPGTVLAFFVLLYLILNYYCFRVEIGKDGFYCRTSPWNGKFYSYSEITSCRKVRRTVHRHAHSGGPKTNCYFFFEFTCKDGKKRRFLFEEPIYGQEIQVLKERIKQAENPSAERADKTGKKSKRNKTTKNNKFLGLIFTGTLRIMGIVSLFAGIGLIFGGVHNYAEQNTPFGIKDLIVFIVCGLIFAVIGFFLSGVWALIGRIRRKGEPPEEEILPPEEYADPEETETDEGRWTVVSIIIRIAAIALILGYIFLSVYLKKSA